MNERRFEEPKAAGTARPDDAGDHAGADSSRRVAVAGFATTTVTFGPARSAIGLFVPQLRADFGFSTAAVGVLTALGYAGFLIGLVVALEAKQERWAVMVGATAATAGLGVVAVAPNVTVLGVGVVLAASSAGLTWSTFNGIADKAVRAERADTTLALVSTGTAFGLASTGGVALVVALGDATWRWAWASFALAAFVVIAIDLSLLPRTPDQHGHVDTPHELRRSILTDGASKLLLAGGVAGLANSAWLSFAVDAVTSAGGDAALGRGITGPLMFVALGLAGLAAVRTATMIHRWGIRPTLRVALVATAASLVMVGALPHQPAAALLSAATQGFGIMVASACLASMSLRLHPGLPVHGFTAVLLAVAAGNIAGAATTGFMGDRFGLCTALIAGGSLLAAVSFVVTRSGGRRGIQPS